MFYARRRKRKQMKTVRKKILPQYFKQVKMKKKNFEIRVDENYIQAGDLLVLEEWDGKVYTGEAIIRIVKYVLRDCPALGLRPGYCIISW